MKPLAAAVGTPPDPEGDKVGLSPASKMTMDEHIQRAVSLGIEKYTDEITKAKQRELEKYETICEVKRKAMKDVKRKEAELLGSEADTDSDSSVDGKSGAQLAQENRVKARMTARMDEQLGKVPVLVEKEIRGILEGILFNDSKQYAKLPSASEEAKNVETATARKQLSRDLMALSNSHATLVATNKTLELRLATASNDLAKEKSAHQNTKNIVKARDTHIRMMSPLFLVGLAARLGRWERQKSIRVTGGEWLDIRGTPVIGRIHERNRVLYQGDEAADRAVLVFAEMTPKEKDRFLVEFEAVYGMEMGDLGPSKLLKNIVNARGTMYNCLHGTKYTHNKASDAKFKELFEECKRVWLMVLKLNAHDAEAAAKVFDKMDDVGKKLEEMKPIVTAAVSAQKERAAQQFQHSK